MSPWQTYVAISGTCTNEILKEAKLCINSHLKYLAGQGMGTNLSKTEAVFFGRDTKTDIQLGSESFSVGTLMKALGMTFNNIMKMQIQK